MSYLDAGVDIDAGNALIKRIQPLARRTRRDGVLKGIGGFGALFEVPRKYREPVLVSGADGVGTKLKLAAQLGRHAAIGQDLVAMCVNDILTLGAEPLFFLDYFACGKLDVEVAATVINGIAAGCEQAGCALIGGETAEMPGMYPGGEYDLAGFAVGVVEKKAIIDGRSMTAGDIVIGLASSGIHSNGYSLVRRMIERARPDLNAELDGRSLADALMAPTRIYVKPIRALLERAPIKGIAHITGGGLIENIPRALPESLCAELDACAWPRPPVFEWLREHGQLAETDMQRVFNCGIGMALVVDAGIADAALTQLLDAGEAAWRIGSIRARQAHEPQVVVRASSHNEARKCHI
ncbi:phosphoribosylformylglycinamidine cyclo-ligase [Candidatus Glomeribacter gigasporarum]|uniref:phosphoribosylformylglycinamidine cyclo-ligase n=1 Tax=Candidatus Glomeribacter gigasporarum TaxID=132144 RepID=UPI001EF06D81|nr:phosphoribosylformylglycinamidine cyclo-ligase [Candidatus Glomeribacter gigasporarum]